LTQPKEFFIFSAEEEQREQDKMGRICAVCGKKTIAGRSYASRGLARRKKGAGIKITGITKRNFAPNLVKKRIVLNGKVVTTKVCTQCLKSGRAVLAS
jgi:large subunit ribosomal protein L28